MWSIFGSGSNLSRIANKWSDPVARSLLRLRAVEIHSSTLIGIRHLGTGTSQPLVILARNQGGSVAGYCLLEGFEPAVVDGPTAGLVLRVIEDVLEVLLLTRRPGEWRTLREAQ
jgi:hypothetical protein